LRFYAEAAPGAAFVDVAQPYTDGDCEGNVFGFAGDGSFVIAHGPSWDCHRGPSTHTVYAVKDGVVSTWPSVDVPFTPRQWRSDIFPAANGGAWLAPTGAPQADATIIGLGPNGGASVRLLGDGDAMNEPVYGAWRGGVVVARRSVDESGPVFAVAVTDGVHETKLVGIPAPWSFVEPPPAVASSPDGSSLLLAYPYFDGDDDGLAVVRVDCLAAD
jgi:hypothetical protein